MCNEVAGAIGLKNLVAEHLRGEDEKGKYDFVVSRAVMQLPDLMKIIKKNFKKLTADQAENAVPIADYVELPRAARAGKTAFVRNDHAWNCSIDVQKLRLNKTHQGLYGVV